MSLSNRLRHFMELEGRPPADWFSPHALRRARARHNYERVDLVAIQQMLGHWTVGSTTRYLRPYDRKQLILRPLLTLGCVLINLRRLVQQ